MLLRKRFLVFLLLVLAAAAAGQETFEGVRRIVAIGDVHGDYGRFVNLLRAAGLMNDENQWTGGQAHLVQAGDAVDRGPASRKVLDLLIDLEAQASKAGGRVHALLGNHEAMNIYGDLRYVPVEEYALYRTQQSSELRDRYFDLLVEDLKAKGLPPPDRRAFEAEHPLGWVEHRQAFGPRGVYGQWLLGHKVIIKINDIVFVHGGISPKYANTSMRDINRQVSEELRDLTRLQGGMTVDPDGPLWYRGLALSPEDDNVLAPTLDQTLKAHEARRMIIGHTPMVAVLPRFGGRVITIDVGLSAVFGGPPAFLIIKGSEYYVMHRGKRLKLPAEGGDPRSYLKAAAALDPRPSPIQKLIEGKTSGELEPGIPRATLGTDAVQAYCLN